MVTCSGDVATRGRRRRPPDHQLTTAFCAHSFNQPAGSGPRAFSFSSRELKDLRLGLGLQRIVARLLVPEHLAQIALVDLLTAVRAVVEMALFADQVAAVQLAGDRWAEVG